MEPLFENAYVSIEDFSSRDDPELAEMIHDKGLPLETICLIDGRVVIVTEIDYEEGRSAPLVRRWYAWREIRCILPENRDGLQHETLNLVVGRDGTQHVWSSAKWT